MERLRLTLERYSRWKPYIEYVERIEGYQHTDFSMCVENSKALLESVAKEICTQKKHPLLSAESVSGLLHKSFASLGYAPTSTIRQIGTAIANIGQQMGNLRNEIGTTAHGKTLEEMKNRSGSVNSLTDGFLISSTELVCCFLIESFETDNPLAPVVDSEIAYDDNPEFNERWDEIYGKFRMTNDYTYSASQILFSLDFLAYESELNAFNSSPDESEVAE